MILKKLKNYSRFKKILNIYILIIFFSFILSIGFVSKTIERIIFASKVSFGSNAMRMTEDGISAFPHFFLPKNGSLFWGWSTLADNSNDFVIILGLAMTLLIFLALFLKRVRSLSSAQMVFIMFLVFGVMMLTKNAYGMFKIAMFIQPFFISTLATFIYLYISPNLLGILLGMAYFFSMLPFQQSIISRVSTGVRGSAVPFATQARIGEQLRSLKSAIASDGSIKRIFSDTPSIELFALESYYFKGLPFDHLAKALPLQGSPGENELFVFSGKQTTGSVNFRQKSKNISDANSRDYLLTTSKEFSVINRCNDLEGFKINLLPLHSVNNHLVLEDVSSSNRDLWAGNLFGAKQLYQLELDPAFPGQTISAVARQQVYEVLGLIPGSKLGLWITDSYNRAAGFRLPQAISIEGSANTNINLMGRGSARIYSSEISPKKIADGNYIGIDYGREENYIDRERSGAMALFGKNVKLDTRRIVLSARNICLFTPLSFEKYPRLSEVSDIRRDIQNNGLEYSGIFEDGWISEAAFVILKNPALNTKMIFLNIQASIPEVQNKNFKTNVSIKLNDHEIYNGLISPGDVVLRVPVKSTDFSVSGNSKIVITSSNLQDLPNGDGRSVSMLIQKIGFIMQ